MKKFIIALMLCAPMTMFAQQKFGHINAQDILTSMPEYSIAQGEVQAKAKELDNELQEMQTEFQKNYEDYQKVAETLPETKRQEKETELQTQYQKIQQAQQDAQQTMQKLQQEKMEPLTTKLQAAISAVGKAGGYVYIMDLSMGLPYISDTLSEDVTMKVKAELKK